MHNTQLSKFKVKGISDFHELSYFYRHVNLNTSFSKHFSVNNEDPKFLNAIRLGIINSAPQGSFYFIHPLHSYLRRQDFSKRSTSTKHRESHIEYYKKYSEQLLQDIQSKKGDFSDILQLENENLLEFLNDLIQCNRSIETVMQLVMMQSEKQNTYEKQIALLNFILVHYEQLNQPNQSSQSIFENVSISCDLATLYRKKGMYESAMSIYQDNLNLWISKKAIISNDGFFNSTRVILLEYISITYRLMKKYDKAKDSLLMALPLAIEYSTRELQANIYIELGNLYKAIFEYESSQNYFLRAMELSEELPSIQVIIQFNLGTIADDNMRWEESLGFYDKALDYFKIEKDLRLQAHTFQNMGLVEEERGNAELAIQYFKTAITIFIELGDRYLEAQMYQNLSIPSLYLSRYAESLNYLKKALLIYQDLGEMWLEAEVYQNVGEVYRKKKDYQSAMKNNERALQLYRESSDEIGQGKIYQNLGNIALECGEYDNAEKYYHAALKIFQSALDENSKAAVFQNSFQLERIRKNYQLSKNYAFQALEIYCQFKNFTKIGWLVAVANLTAYQLNNKSILVEMNGYLEDRFTKNEIDEILVFAKHFHQGFKESENQ